MGALTKGVLTYRNMNPDGSWPGINYDEKVIGNWTPIKHLERLQLLTIAYANPKSVYHADVSLYQTIVKGLHFWYNKNPRSSNWWHNDIATPQYLGRILLLMQASDKNLPEVLQKDILKRMQGVQAPFTFTGANKLDIAIHYIYRALATNNEKLMNIGVMEAFQPVAFTTGEGVQYDYSFQQHKEQLMISSYGLVFIIGEYEVASWLVGTKYALAKDKLDLLNNYFFYSFANALRGGFMDYNTEGRGVSRPDILDKRKLPDGGLFHNILMADPTKKEQLEVLHERMSGRKPADFEVEPIHIHYWKGDYTIHKRPAYSFNVRTVSKRTVRTETGNKENLLGSVMPDGSVNLLRRGDEYINIMPVWEWDKIPGVTARDYDTAVTMKKQWGEYGSTSFVGGVSDSVYGATVYQQEYDEVKAKKSYFFFDNEILCLGAGINSHTPQNITTTLNQAWSSGKVMVMENNKSVQLRKNAAFKNLQWVWHDSVAYIFPTAQNVFISNQTQTGNWNNINKNNKGEVKGPVFKIWLDHGKNPSLATYEYIVVPGIGDRQIAQYDSKALEVISNTEAIQAVVHHHLKIIQAVFYTPGELKFGEVKIKVNQPCVLQVRNFGGEDMKLSVADPAQHLKEITITLSTENIKEKEWNVLLPQAPFAGRSVSVSNFDK